MRIPQKTEVSDTATTNFIHRVTQMNIKHHTKCLSFLLAEIRCLAFNKKITRYSKKQAKKPTK